MRMLIQSTPDQLLTKALKTGTQDDFNANLHNGNVFCLPIGAQKQWYSA